ncbi:hypothetical protein C0991_001024 [Blastosporella zonata]|nr:hypothetical protein C0991_001024 [Blastosporella zonata]
MRYSWILLLTRAPGSPEFWYKIIVSGALVLAGGVFAGLTLGLMGLDELHLRVLATSSADPAEQRNAKTVLNLMSKGRHWILVVLLLCNVVINESLPIFLDSAIGGGIAAVVISTTAIAPIAYPIAKLLDWVLGGKEHHTYKKAELKSFLQFHRTGEEPLRDDEIAILNGVLELNTKNVESIMTPMKEMISEEIVDETDRYQDNQSKLRAKRMTTSAIMRGIVERHRRASLISIQGETSPLLSGTPRTYDSVIHIPPILSQSPTRDS